MLEEFKKFLFRGNVLDLLVGVVIGTSFGALVAAFVSDLVTPFVAVIIKVPDFSSLTFIINGSKFTYGHFLNAIISFILITGSVFLFIVKPVNLFMSRKNKKSAETPEEDNQ